MTTKKELTPLQILQGAAVERFQLKGGDFDLGEYYICQHDTEDVLKANQEAEIYVLNDLKDRKALLKESEPDWEAWEKFKKEQEVKKLNKEALKGLDLKEPENRYDQLLSQQRLIRSGLYYYSILIRDKDNKLLFTNEDERREVVKTIFKNIEIVKEAAKKVINTDFLAQEETDTAKSGSKVSSQKLPEAVVVHGHTIEYTEAPQ